MSVLVDKQLEFHFMYLSINNSFFKDIKETYFYLVPGLQRAL